MTPRERWVEIKLLEYADALERWDFDTLLEIAGSLNDTEEGKVALDDHWRTLLVDLDLALEEDEEEQDTL
jgi:hypothetical protein